MDFTDLQLEPGMYVVAVSGGVDSMALLHILYNAFGTRHSKVRFVVAHFDHGIRQDSGLDRQLVQERAELYGFPFVYDEGWLGPETSESTARDRRYRFLHRVRDGSAARAILTAHHQDDMLETAVLNLLRGTKWRGLVSLRSTPTVKRPLLNTTKQELVTYAHQNYLTWREDSTNQELRYIRNHVRHVLLPSLREEQKQELLQHIHKISNLRADLETELLNHLHMQPGLTELDRKQFILLPHAVAREVMATWLNRFDIQDVSSPKLERLVVAAKTYRPGQQADIDKTYILVVTRDRLALVRRER